MKHLLGIICIAIFLGGLGCQQPFAFEIENINYDLLGSGRLFITSQNLLQNYYIDVDAREAYYVPLPKSDNDDFAVDGVGENIYSVYGASIYHAEVGNWKWEKLALQLPIAGTEGGNTQKLAVSPDNKFLYFIMSNFQTPDRPLMSMDLETGGLTDLSAKSGYDITHYRVNPISGEIVFLTQELEDSTLQFFLMNPDGSDVEMIYSAETELPYFGVPSNVMNWTPDGKEIVFLLSNQDYIFRYNLESHVLNKSSFDKDLNYYNSGTRIAFSPDGERIAYGYWESAMVVLGNRDLNSYNGTENTIVSLCEYSCYNAGEIYWWK